MGDLDNIFKNNFGGERNGLPAEQENQLWDSIVDELGDDNSIPTPVKPWISIRTGLIILALGMIPLAFYLGRQSTENGLAENNEVNSEVIVDSNGEKTGKENIISSSMEFEEGGKDELINSKQSSISTNKIEKAIVDNSIITELKNDERLDKLNTNTNNPSSEVTNNNEDLSSNTESLGINESQKSQSEKDIAVDNSKPLNTENNVAQVDNIINEKKAKNFDRTLPLKNAKGDLTNKDVEEDIEFEKSDEKAAENESTSVDNKQNNFSGENKAKEFSEENQNSNQGSNSNSNQSALSIEKLKNNSAEANFENELVSTSFLERMKVLTFDFKREENKPKLTAIPKARNPIRFAITGIGGVNRSAISYNGSNTGFAARKNDSERAYYGQTVGLEFSTIYKSKWILNTGLQHEIQRTIYEESIEKEITRDVKGISGILVNADSYEVLDEYEADSTETYNTVNYVKQINNFTSLRVPIQVGYQYNRNRFSYGILAGATLRFRIAQEGILLDNNEELTDIISSQNFFYNSLNVGLNISPFINYRVTENLGVIVNYDVSVYNPVISLDQSLGLYNTTQALRIGVRYFLK